MRILSLSKSGLNKLRSHQFELKAVDLDDPLRSITPGEWCVLSAAGINEKWIGYGNPLVDEKFTGMHVVYTSLEKDLSHFSIENFISKKISEALNRRLRFKGYDRGARIFYGAVDGLPGLIVDRFVNACIIQINTAGLDKYRDFIKEFIHQLTQTNCYLLDNEKYREKESLPTFKKDPVPDLDIEENGIKFSLRSEVIQKVGFYYDHRENRNQLMNLLKRLPEFKMGVDLFCYAGAWGLSALKEGVAQMMFVDQGEFSEEIKTGLELNQLSSRGEFKRMDVFKFLDQSLSEGRKFDVILCDPPAFAKSLSQKKDALEGYSKLHRKVFKLASPGALIAFSSCTHYVEHEEFQKNIIDAASKEGKKIQLLYCGLQGWDHPVMSLADRSNYIKSYFYLLES